MFDTKMPILALLVALWCAGGCPEDPPGDDDTGDDDASDDDAGDDDAGGDCDRYDTVGFFGVSSRPAYTGGDGAYYDGPFPLILDEVLSEGECVFLGWDPLPFCDPPCDPPLQCGFGNVCRPWPELHDVGSVTLSDSGGLLVELEPTEHFVYLTGESLDEVIPPGEAVILAASGGPEVGAFSREVRMVDPWPEGELQETIVQGQEMVVEWEPGTVPGVRVRVRMDIDHHAQSSASVECIADDAAGQVVVPVALVDALIAAGHSGIGTYVENAYIDRFHEDVGPHDFGCVGFVAQAHRQMGVETVLAD